MLALTIWRPSAATAQAGAKVQPLYHVAVSAQTGVVGLTPAQVRRAYGFDQIENQGAGQTIGIVAAFDYPDIERDLAVFDQAFGLPPCTTKNRCFQKVDMSGGRMDPNGVWPPEIALDVEWAHAIARQAKILLVEAADDTLDSLLAAVDTAVRNGATVVSMSWGAAEFSTEMVDEDGHFVGRNVTFFAASGDRGHGVIYPSASPYVMSVGGTTLHVSNDGSYGNEKAWDGSGGGLSSYEPEPVYQASYPIPNNPQLKRGTPDVAYDGDPNTGVAVYNSVPLAGWFQLGGTSIGPPQWSALVAIANSMRHAARKPPLTGSQGVLYDAANIAYAANYHDVNNGNNGKCDELCKTGKAYDYVTGLGTPRADSLILALKDLPR